MGSSKAPKETCPQCGGPLPPNGKPGEQYCSPECRTQASRNRRSAVKKPPTDGRSPAPAATATPTAAPAPAAVAASGRAPAVAAAAPPPAKPAAPAAPAVVEAPPSAEILKSVHAIGKRFDSEVAALRSELAAARTELASSYATGQREELLRLELAETQRRLRHCQSELEQVRIEAQAQLEESAVREHATQQELEVLRLAHAERELSLRERQTALPLLEEERRQSALLLERLSAAQARVSELEAAQHRHEAELGRLTQSELEAWKKVAAATERNSALEVELGRVRRDHAAQLQDSSESLDRTLRQYVALLRWLYLLAPLPSEQALSPSAIVHEDAGASGPPWSNPLTPFVQPLVKTFQQRLVQETPDSRDAILRLSDSLMLFGLLMLQAELATLLNPEIAKSNLAAPTSKQLARQIIQRVATNREVYRPELFGLIEPAEPVMVVFAEFLHVEVQRRLHQAMRRSDLPAAPVKLPAQQAAAAAAVAATGHPAPAAPAGHPAPAAPAGHPAPAAPAGHPAPAAPAAPAAPRHAPAPAPPAAQAAKPVPAAVTLPQPGVGKKESQRAPSQQPQPALLAQKKDN